MGGGGGSGPCGEGPCNVRLFVFVAFFALGMLLFEVCMEALFLLPDIPHTISLWNTTVHFVFCSLLPGLVTTVQKCWAHPRPRAGVAAVAPSALDLEKAIEELPPPPAQKQGSWADLARLWAPYVVISALQFAAGVAANHSVHFVDFTLKVVFKASKLLPTMLLSGLMGNNRAYSAQEYLAAVLLCCGTALFSCGGGKDGAGGHPGTSLAIGAGLLLFAVLAEGVVPNLQQALMRGGASPNELMLRINIVGAVCGVIGLTLSGDGYRLAAYASTTPEVVFLLLAGGLTFSISVMSYTHLIEEAGSVFAVGVSTLRKSATVLLSFLLFPGKSFNAVRGFGLVAVLAGVILADRAVSRGRSKPRRPPDDARALRC